MGVKGGSTIVAISVLAAGCATSPGQPAGSVPGLADVRIGRLADRLQKEVGDGLTSPGW